MSAYPKVDLGTVFKGSPNGKIVKAQGGQRELRPHDVAIDIAYSGLCYTDMHFRTTDMVLGHEGVGVVSRVGSEVKVLKAGDRVGYGYNHDSCGYCDYCMRGDDIFCPDNKMYGVSDHDIGGFSDRVVLNAMFVHKIPDEITLKDAAPMQCAGITVYAAIVNAGVKPGERAAVLGVGGLGHLVIQFLNHMGCEVVVFSSTSSKKDLAMKLGAHEFVASKENPEFKGVKGVDYLFVSTSAQPDWKLYLSVMNPEGTVVPLTVDFSDMTHPYFDIVFKQLKICGSLVGRRYTHRKMLEFAAFHNVRAMIEELPMTEEGLNTAFERLEKGDVRFRFVLKSQTTDAN